MAWSAAPWTLHRFAIAWTLPETLPMKLSKRFGQRATSFPPSPNGLVRIRPRLEHLDDRLLPAASLLKDINVATGSSSPAEPAVLNGVVYFEADDGVHG